MKERFNIMNHKRKLLFFDIDGTLLTGGFDGYVPDSAIKALKKAQANGHYCFINSGRTRSFLPKQILDFPFDGYILGCGTEINLHGETIYQKTLPMELKRSLAEKSRRSNMQIVAEGPYHIYYDEKVDLFKDVRNLLDFYDTFMESPTVLPFSSKELDFSKFVVVFKEDGNVPLFKELIKGDFDYIDREGFKDSMFAEIVPVGCSKATGIDFLVEYLGLTLEDCYVFGDSNNDLSMLTHVKHSIAMGNSCPEILNQTEYVTTDIDEDGIYNALKHYNLI